MRVLLLMALWAGATGTVTAADEVDYQRQVKPLLAEKCGACHGVLKQESGLRLDAGALVLRGSDNGAVVIPGNAAESLLIRKVSAADVDERMPPAGEGEPLDERQIALLAAWIDAGAVTPQDEEVLADPRSHWAYQLPERPPLPPDAAAHGSHPIDAFIAAARQQQGLTAAPLADRHTLLRRVYLDLIGLPPTRAQLQQFLQDDSAMAWERVVDSLLNNPHYGERWGRHWMDVWRYSDWDGYKQQLRGSQRHIWRWRDWIVQSLNADKGYDRMIVEMLAADEIAPVDESLLPATGFLARNFHTSNRNIWLDATVEHTAKAFLGITLNCARCHDHKYDPLPQAAYYRFRAVFEPHQVRTERLPGQPDLTQHGLSRAYDADLAAPTFLFQQGNEKRPDKDHPLEPAVPVLLGGRFEIQPVQLPVAAYYPAIREFVVEEELAAARRQLAKTQKQLADALPETGAGEGESPADSPQPKLAARKLAVAELRLATLLARQAADRAKYLDAAADDQQQQQPEQLARTAAESERRLNLEQAELTVLEKQAALAAAEAGEEKDEKKKQAALESAKKALADAEKNRHAARQALEKNDQQYTPLGKEYPRTSSGRRLALARWIASPDNPLTARVAVNHIWLRHFGAPLVDNVFDFGLRSPRPRHADLLDWLAVELMESGWSMKHLHRLIVTSRTWRLASAADPAAAEQNRLVDADNHYLWRANVRRLDAEVIRDNVLAVAGQLEATLGGPDIDFREGEKSRRRSIYLRHAYEKQMTMLVLFDAASPAECYRRSESIIPQQALALTNSSLALGQSRLLARGLWREAAAGGGDAACEFVRAAFLQILSRPPAEAERAACLQFLTTQAATLSDPTKLTPFDGGAAAQIQPAADPHARARENLVHVLMNHNDFITVR